MSLFKELLTEAVKKKDMLEIIRSGKLDRESAKDLKTELTKIFVKYTKSGDWKHNKSGLDYGLVYNGDDTEEAVKAAENIVGDLFGYFHDGVSMSARMRIKKETRRTKSGQLEVWSVEPHEGNAEIEFFYNPNVQKGGNAVGLLISP